MASRTTTPRGDYDLSDPVNSFVDVVRRVVLQPANFFTGLPRQGSFLGPLVFALICIELSAVLVGLLTFIGVPGGVTWLLGARGDQGFLAFVGGLVVAPIAGTVGVFLTALVTHLLVILVVGSGHSGFGATFRIVAYSSVTSLLGWIPFIGWIFSLYRLYLATVGIREMHGTTTGRALLVVLLPAILVLLLVVVLVGASAIVYFRAA
ncbi:MAG: YIP1 family protein [Actinomycetota bacterium]|nr:YIP1 family protein [Actinomycetota bacterium]